MEKITNNINKTLKDFGIKTRPNASLGYWVLFLLPVSIILSYARNPKISSHQYKLATLVATGFFVSNIVILVQCVKKNNFKLGVPHILTAVYTSSLFYTCLHEGILFSILSGFGTTLAFFRGFPLLLKITPKCFTFGEASMVAQGVVLFVYISFVNFGESLVKIPVKTCHISNIILQVGLTGVLLICTVSYKFASFRKAVPFYILTGTVLFVWVFFLLHVILQRSPVLWIINLLTENFSTIRMLIFWVACFSLAVFSLRRQIVGGRKASTIVRKTFHILAVAALLPGIIDQCSVLYLATGCVLAIFIALETLRVLNQPPLGPLLQDGFTVFSDEKDIPGGLALTPMYLLVGCALPVWIHPEPCDVTDSAGFNLLPLISGLLSVGVGDTMASAVGIYFGRFKWSGTSKTIEGTLACILGQIALVAVLMNFGYVSWSNENIVRSALAITISSVVEAKTDQVDNLILPLVTYMFLV